jgi:hypothetical protein
MRVHPRAISTDARPGRRAAASQSRRDALLPSNAASLDYLASLECFAACQSLALGGRLHQQEPPAGAPRSRPDTRSATSPPPTWPSRSTAA